MSMTAQPPLRLIPAPRHVRAAPVVGWLFRCAVAVLVLAVVLGALFEVTARRRALRALPAQQRAAVLARTVDELRDTCGPGAPDALRDHCRELASFAAQFDDCRGECDALVRRQLAAAPTR